jgi:hypothetical protein
MGHSEEKGYIEVGYSDGEGYNVTTLVTEGKAAAAYDTY